MTHTTAHLLKHPSPKPKVTLGIGIDKLTATNLTPSMQSMHRILWVWGETKADGYSHITGDICCCKSGGIKHA